MVAVWWGAITTTWHHPVKLQLMKDILKYLFIYKIQGTIYFVYLSLQETDSGGVAVEEGAEPSETDRLVAFIRLLNDLFWKIFVQRPANPAIAPVVNPGESHDCHMMSHMTSPLLARFCCSGPDCDVYDRDYVVLCAPRQQSTGCRAKPHHQVSADSGELSVSLVTGCNTA